MKKYLCCALLCSGCFSGGGHGSGSFECSLDDRSGTLRTRFTEQTGNCGPIPETIDRLPSYDYVPDGCWLDGPDIASADECRLERAYTCETELGSLCPPMPPPAAGDPVRVDTARFVAVTEQQSPERFTGTVTMRVVCWDGSVVCVSTYRIEATRE